eukprot:4700255-Alexandrium_andersonii.AAC.1
MITLASPASAASVFAGAFSPAVRWPPAGAAITAQSPVDAVLQQLGACGTLLRAMRGRSAFGQLSVAEAQRAGQALRTAALSPVDVTRVVEAVNKTGFEPSDEGQLLDTLGE